MIHLIIGGAKSGKSKLAETYITRNKTYIATAQIFDAEMAARVAAHRVQRGEGWRLVEAPYDLCGALRGLSADDEVLIDCATLWLTNHFLNDADLAHETQRLLAALRASPAKIVIVTNEVGWSIVPENAMARRFRDAQGRLNQQLAEVADHVVLVVAGLPMVLK